MPYTPKKNPTEFEKRVIEAGYLWVSTVPLNRKGRDIDYLGEHQHNSINTHLIKSGQLTLDFGGCKETLDAHSGQVDDKECQVNPRTLYSGLAGAGGCIFVEGHRRLSLTTARRMEKKGDVKWSEDEEAEEDEAYDYDENEYDYIQEDEDDDEDEYEYEDCYDGDDYNDEEVEEEEEEETEGIEESDFDEGYYSYDESYDPDYYPSEESTGNSDKSLPDSAVDTDDLGENDFAGYDSNADLTTRQQWIWDNYHKEPKRPIKPVNLYRLYNINN